MPNASGPPTVSPAPVSLVSPGGHERPRIVVAGGGVAALEGVLALHESVGPHVDIDLVSSESDFVYKPLAVGEPFGVSGAWHMPLSDFVRNRAALRPGRLASVDTERKVAVLDDGQALPYDALLVAVGARRREWLEGALHFGGPETAGEFADLLQELREGIISRIAFVVPAATSWTLPLYELAILTAAHAQEHELPGVEITIVTPEPEPLAVFGPTAGAAVSILLRERGIELRTARYPGRFEWATLPLQPTGVVHPDRIVTMPRLAGWEIPGLPADPDGFIPVDDHGAVFGAPGVYAAGDGTAFPVKQGGLAAQQADAAAAAIAESLGAAVTAEPFKPVLRAQLLTGLTPVYLRTSIDPREDEATTVGRRPMWWPPSKIAGRHLAPILAAKAELHAGDTLLDRTPTAADPAVVEESNAEICELARAFADEDARRGEYDSALLWLDSIERLYGVLPSRDAELRRRWRREAGSAD